MKKLFTLITALIFFSTASVMAHGVQVDVSLQYPVVITKSYYSASQPLKGADIDIYSPDNAEEPYQTGKTGQAGYFAFIPSREGDWKVIADDGQGHRKETIITIEKSFFSGQEQELIIRADTTLQHTHHHTEEEHEAKGFYSIIFGLSIIFGITGIFYGLKARQQYKK